MSSDTYKLGYDAPTVDYMAHRTAEVHGAFFLPYLQPGWRVLDGGCGPGTITLGLAHVVEPGQVTGIDLEDRQFASGREQVEREGLNVEFHKASVYELPFQAGSFDAVFSHAMLEHLSTPAIALREFRRVLKPGGLIGVRSLDLGGLLIDAPPQAPAHALVAHLASALKDPNLGRKLGRLLWHAGFTVQKIKASYEGIDQTFPTTMSFAARPSADPGDSGSSRAKIGDGPSFVAMAWVEAIGKAG